jgi:hypothetical protein
MLAQGQSAVLSFLQWMKNQILHLEITKVNDVFLKKGAW